MQGKTLAWTATRAWTETLTRAMTTAWLFPGQGAQFVGMGKELLETSPAARQVFERASTALGESMSRLVLEGPEADLTLTANAQPALVTTSTAILAAIRERIASLPLPAFAAGHSLGEYSALVAAEAITLEDAVRLVRARGRAMQDAVPAGTGAMAAVLSVDAVVLESICREAAQGEVVSPANFNAPGQIVIAGHAAAVTRASELCAAAKGKAILLKVSAPFHCALMAPAARAVEAELAHVAVAVPRFPIVANVDGLPNTDPARTKELLVRQVDGAVRWEQAVRYMVEQGVTHALEIGPGKVLAGLAKRIAKELKVLSVSDPASIAEIEAFLAA
jgi:[acyl-carrier-protein] S-malonyltransferase